MAAETVTTDRTLGFSVLFALLGIIAALVMLFGALGGGQLTAAWGFAAAMVAAGLLIVVIHVG